MSFDKAAALAALANVDVEPGVLGKTGGKPDQAKLSAALDELFGLAGDKVVKGVDYHVHGGEADNTSDLDVTVLTVWLITGVIEDGVFHEDFGFPNRRVPIVG